MSAGNGEAGRGAKPAAPRLFIAVPAAPDVRCAAAGIIAELRSAGADCSWVAPGNLHITLRFLGATPADRFPEVETLLLEAAQRPAFELGFGGLGVFASWEQPKVLWLGVLRGAAELCAMAAALGPPEAGRPFSAHLTFGRLRSRRNLERLRQTAASARLPDMSQRVDKLVLYESRLTPQGAVYTALREAALLAAG